MSCEEDHDPAPGPAPVCFKCFRPCKVYTAGPASSCPGRKYWKCCEVNGQTSFQWFPRYRIDMRLRDGNEVLLLEFKRLRPGDVVRFRDPAAPMRAWSAMRTNLAEDRLLVGGGCDLSDETKKRTSASTLQQLEDVAQAQCNRYKSVLVNEGLKVKMACTIIHWTHNDNCPSALLVKEVK